MEYYAIGQDMEINRCRTTMNSIEIKYFENKDANEVVPVRIYLSRGGSEEPINHEKINCGDIINCSLATIYSDKFCSQIKKLDLPLTFQPAKLVFMEDEYETPGYNLIYGIPDIKNLKDDSSSQEPIKIDPTIIKGQSIFNYRIPDAFFSMKVIDENLKNIFDKAQIEGMYMIPVSQLTRFSYEGLRLVE